MDKLDSSTGQVYSLKVKISNISGTNNEIVKHFEYSSTSINTEEMVAPLWVQQQRGHKEVTANETPMGGGEGGGGEISWQSKDVKFWGCQK